jgi:Na+-transporting methylmalonyl-CoA/oxaloacetate decarboxylase gamma subunit
MLVALVASRRARLTGVVLVVLIALALGVWGVAALRGEEEPAPVTERSVGGTGGPPVSSMFKARAVPHLSERCLLTPRCVEAASRERAAE